DARCEVPRRAHRARRPAGVDRRHVARSGGEGLDDRSDEPAHGRSDFRAAGGSQGLGVDVAHYRYPRDAAGRPLRPHAAGTLVRILSVVGARPNLLTLAPADPEAAKRPDTAPLLLGTGHDVGPPTHAPSLTDV